MIKPGIIKKWNNEFKALSKPEQRVAIAEDVIKLIKRKFIKPDHIGYIKIDGRDSNDVLLAYSDQNAQEHFDL